jgi:hypothetical protein
MKTLARISSRLSLILILFEFFTPEIFFGGLATQQKIPIHGVGVVEVAEDGDSALATIVDDKS